MFVDNLCSTSKSSLINFLYPTGQLISEKFHFLPFVSYLVLCTDDLITDSLIRPDETSQRVGMAFQTHFDVLIVLVRA